MLKKNTKPQIMGILNCTPDSYIASSRCNDLKATIEKVESWVNANAVDIIDIGGESTRPSTDFNGQYKDGDYFLNALEEWSRIEKTLIEIRERFPQIPLSIDTRKPLVAQKALIQGAQYVNLITHDLSDPPFDEFCDLLKSFSNAKLVLTHIHGKIPALMQKGPFLDSPIIPHLKKWLEKQLDFCEKKNISKDRIIFDPGVCFGKKNPDQNLEILKAIPEMKSWGLPLLLGISRKSFIGLILSKKSEELLAATIGISTYLWNKGTDILRVHDVLEHKDALELWWAIKCK